MKLYGREWSRADILRRVGDISQLGGVKRYVLAEGKGKGVEGLRIDTGAGLRFDVLTDRCMDIAWADYKGIPISFISKGGVSSSVYFEHKDAEIHRVFAPGLITTCGIRNTGRFCDYEGEHFGQHGRIANAPAENVSVSCEWDGDEYEIVLRGQMREAVLFGENLILTREYRTRIGATSFMLKDTIRNCAFCDENVCFMYHINFGFPLVDEGAKVHFSKGNVMDPKTRNVYDYNDILCTLSSPVDNLPEEGGFIQFAEEKAVARLVNPKLADMKGAYVKFDRQHFKYFSFWKSMGSGDYVVGFEPCTVLPIGRARNVAEGIEFVLKPMEEVNFETEIGIDL